MGIVLSQLVDNLICTAGGLLLTLIDGMQMDDWPLIQVDEKLTYLDCKR